MKKSYSGLRGKTREEIIGLLGNNFHTDSTESILVYIINKTWLNPKGNVLYIEFNEKGKADIILKHKNDE